MTKVYFNDIYIVTMATENFKEQQNPIKFGAEAIKKSTQNLVRGQMQGIFPNNYQWMAGDYNLIFLTMDRYGDQDGGFSKNAHMIVLSPNGEFKSGLVNQKVADDYSSWKFRDARLKDAADLQVVRYGPRLISELFSKLQSEMREYEDPERIARGLKILDMRIQTQTEIARISRGALNAMGEEGETEVSVPTDIRDDIFATIEDAISRTGKKPKLSDFELMKKAFSLYENRKKLVEDIKSLASNMRVKPVEDRLVALASEAIEIDADDKAARKDQDGRVWFVPGQYRGEPISVRHNPDEGWVMAISEGGVREVRLYVTSGSPRWCAEHVLEKAGPIAQAIIGRAVGKVFPKLK